MREWKNSNDKGVIKECFSWEEESWEEYSHIFELKTLFTITYMLSLMKDSMTFVLKNKNKLGG
jgi:hypothetical protein